jgi:1-deoxy-D-xylulose-5-phosphate reductoisomerase
MRTPIAQSLYWPHRGKPADGRFNFSELSNLTFEPIDEARFPAFALATSAMRAGGAAPAVLNGANEAAVEAFLDESIHFLDIATTVSQVMERAEQRGWFAASTDIDAALEIDGEARKLARDVMGNIN